MRVWAVVFTTYFCTTRTVLSACYDARDAPLTCITPPINAAVNRKAEATNTCGNPPEGYCYIGPQRKCEVCDASVPDLSHPIQNINDPFNPAKVTWWQSKTWWTCNQIKLSAMFDPLKVNITLSIGKRYLISGGIYITFYTERPKKMIIERSGDFGKTWEVYQYYAKNCRSAYNLQADPAINPFDPFEPICSQKYSGEFPRSGGIVHFDPRNRYTPGEYYREGVGTYLEATDIRLRLEYPGTDGREYINEESTLNQYYYAISDLRIDARCSCHGHAEYCDIKDGVEKCDCQHFTMGEDCKDCLPMYRNRVWMAGNATNANPCQKCECFDHADNCVYNNFLGTGICQNCQHNTRGIRCDQCIDKFYRNISRELSAIDVCIPCDCYEPGIIDDGKCLQSANGLQQLGQCNCKGGIFGRRCDQCVPGKWGFVTPPVGTCFDCACHPFGTQSNNQVCDPYTGQCSCKAFVTGRTCDRCKEGYYRFPTSLTSDCLSCPCNVGGSLPSCDKFTGVCSCKPGVTGPKCDMVQLGFFFPNFTYIELEPEFSSPNGTFTTYYLARNYARYFTGHGFVRLDYGQSVSFNFEVPLSAKYFLMMRYSLFNLDWYSSILPQGREFVDWAGSTDMSLYLKANDIPGQWLFTVNIRNSAGIVIKSLSFTIANLKMGSDNSIISTSFVELEKGDTYSLEIRYMDSSKLYGSPWPLLLDSANIMLDYTVSEYFQNIELTDVKSEVIQCYEDSRKIATTYNLPSYCGSHTFTIDLEIYGKALECNCFQPGSFAWNMCDAYGGQCQCKEGYGGRACNQCVPGYFGDPSIGCTPCRCSPVGSMSTTCHQMTGQCLCKANGHGLKCDECRMGYFHLSPSNPHGCQACFGYGHLATCTSAMGFVRSFVETNLATASAQYDGWTLRHENGADATSLILRGTNGLEYTDENNRKRYFRAPPLFLGDKLYSYGQTLEVQMDIFPKIEKLAANVLWHVRLSGNGKIALFKFRESLSKARKTYTIILHQSYMVNTTKLSEFDFKAMLGQLTALEICVIYFQPPSTVTLEMVRMNTAAFLPTNTDMSLMVNYVEHATCLRGYKGLSCEMCDNGYTRVISFGGPLVNCVPCSCNDRATVCNDQSGICQNCRAGTMGSYCEKCMENVLEPNCDKCRPGYWGLYSQVNGCRPCDCYLPGTKGGSNNECDSLSGQCVCDTEKNVGGRQCNLCKENSYNISLTDQLRCQECPVCYGLIEDSVLMLRHDILQVQIEIHALVTTLSMANIKPFYQSISAMQDDIALIMIRAEQGKVTASGLDFLWQSLEDKIDLFLGTLNTSALVKMENLLNDANQIFDIHNTTVFQHSFIYGYLINSYNLLNNTVRARMQQQSVALVQLNNLADEMSSYVATATTKANEVLTKKYDLKQKIQVSINAAKMAADSAYSIRMQVFNMTNIFAPVYSRGLEVEEFAKTCVVSIQHWLTNSSEVLLFAETVMHNVDIELVDYSENITELNSVTQLLRNQYNSFSSSIFSLTTNVNAVALEITKLKTSLHHTQISSIERRSSLLLTNLLLLKNKTNIAVESVQEIKQQATTILNTVQNFMLVASEAKRAANEALTKVDAVKSSVETALNTVMSISNQLSGPKSTAEVALQVSNAANFAVTQEATMIDDLLKRAVSLQDNTLSAISFIQNNEIRIYIQQNVNPLLQQCSDYKQNTTRALKSAQNALNQAQQSHLSARTTADQILKLSAHISNVDTVQLSQLDGLVNNINRVRSSYIALNIASRLIVLRGALKDQEEKHERYREKKELLKIGMDRYVQLYNSLSKMTC